MAITLQYRLVSGSGWWRADAKLEQGVGITGSTEAPPSYSLLGGWCYGVAGED